MIRLLKQIKLMEDCVLIHSTVTGITTIDKGDSKPRDIQLLQQ